MPARLSPAPIAPGTAFAVAALGIALFSCMDALMKGLAIANGAYNAMLWRSFAGLVLIVPLVLARPFGWPTRAELWLHARRSVAAGVSVLLFFWGLVRVPMAEGVALTFLSPVIAILLAAPMLGERIRARALAACALAFVGVAVIAIGRARASAGPAAMEGTGAIVLASLFYAYNLVLLRQSAQRSGPVEITVFTNIVFAIFYGAASPVLAQVPRLAQVPALFAAAALAIGSSLLLAWAYAHAEAQRLVSVEYTAFIWSAILGALVFGERVLPWTVAGAALIVGGCFVAIGGGGAVAAPASEAAL